MQTKKCKLKYFTVGEICLWLSTVTLIVTMFCIFDRSKPLNLAASLIGVSGLILVAKGNPIGQVFNIAFAAIYGYISFTQKYYGEMITYLCMSAPMAIVALISWLRHPYSGRKTEVKVAEVKPKTIVIVLLLAAAVTVAFYFILSALGTANIITSTISVTTSFTAVSLNALRSPYFALAYLLNDVVLIVLWSMAAVGDISYMSVVAGFIAFLANDTYTFLNWRRLKRRQNSDEKLDRTANDATEPDVGGAS